MRKGLDVSRRLTSAVPLNPEFLGREKHTQHSKVAHKVTEDGGQSRNPNIAGGGGGVGWGGGSWEEKVGPREQMRWGMKLTRLARAERGDSFLKTVS